MPTDTRRTLGRTALLATALAATPAWAGNDAMMKLLEVLHAQGTLDAETFAALKAAAAADAADAAPAAPVAAVSQPAQAATPAAAPAAAAPPAAQSALEARQRSLEERVEKLAETQAAEAAEPKKKHWYDDISLRGYIQTREAFVLGGDEDVRLWSDASVGEDRNFTFRRVRLVISGDVGNWLHLYLQPDFGSTAGEGNNNFAQLRDAYGDVSFDAEKEFRLRVGQSKVPFGFENLQSSSHRLALERTDAINSAAPGERDIGAFFMWAPAEKRKLFKELTSSGLKGSGDYGVFALGVHNGQGINATEQNDDLHVVGRFTWPFKTASGQVFEGGVQAYTGNYVPTSSGAVAGSGQNFADRRVGVHAVMYPQPFGLQAEWNWGEGPALNLAQTAIETDSLNGGYVQAMYRLENFRGTGTWTPFVRWQYFDGALKFRTNAPRTHVNDWELGLEWQYDPAIELTMAYHLMDRNDVTRKPYADFESEVLRLQLQYNY